MDRLLLLLLLLVYLFFGVARVEQRQTGEQTVVVRPDGDTRAGPTIVNGRYQLPASGTVVRAVVNNGPLPPEYQEGYEISIDVGGLATAVVTPQGAAADLGEERTAEQRTMTVDLGPDGLQALLRDLDATGFFFLPQRHELEPNDFQVGGPVSNLTVTLAGGVWDVQGAGLRGQDLAWLDEAQAIVARAIGLERASADSVANHVNAVDLPAHRAQVRLVPDRLYVRPSPAPG